MDAIQITKECANDFLGPAGSVSDSTSQGREAEGETSVPLRGKTIHLARNLDVRLSIIQGRASPPSQAFKTASHLQLRCLPYLPLDIQSLRLSPTDWNPLMYLECPYLAYPFLLPYHLALGLWQ